MSREGVAVRLRRAARGIEPIVWFLFALAGGLGLAYLHVLRCALDGC